MSQMTRHWKHGAMDTLTAKDRNFMTPHLRQKSQAEQQQQPAGPDQQSFRASRGVRLCEEQPPPRLGRPQRRTLSQLADESSHNKIEASDFFMEQASALQLMTPKGFKQWYNSKEVG